MRRLRPALVALSVIAVITGALGDAEAAKKKKKPKKPPAVAAPAMTPSKPVETPAEATPSTDSSAAWGDVPLPPGMAAPKPVTPAPAPAPAPVPTAPVVTPVLPTGAAPNTSGYVIAVIVEGASARDLDRELRKAFGDKVQIVSPAQLQPSVEPKDQRVFEKPPNKRDLGRAMKRVAKRAGLDGVVYANVGGSTKEGYTANVLLLYRSGKIGVDASVPVSKVVRQRGHNVLRWQYSNVSDLLAPGIDGLTELPPPGEPVAPQPADQGSLSDSISSFDNHRGTTPERGEEGAPIEEVVATAEMPSDGVSMFNRRMGSPLILKVGMQAGHRQFAYNEPITSNLRDYSVGVAPLAVLEAEAYPFARTTVAVLKNIGWYASFAHAFGLQSSFKTADQAGEQLKVGNNWTSWQVGLHSRFRIGDHFGIGPQLTYGFLNYGFKFKDATDERAFEVPDVRYNFLRAGLEAHLPIWILDLSVGAGWSTVLTGGRVASTYFPNSQTGLVDGYVTIGLPISARLALDGSIRYSRYFYTMHPAIGDTYVAGGAVDQYATASLSLVFLLEEAAH